MVSYQLDTLFSLLGRGLKSFLVFVLTCWRCCTECLCQARRCCVDIRWYFLPCLVFQGYSYFLVDMRKWKISDKESSERINWLMACSACPIDRN